MIFNFTFRPDKENIGHQNLSFYSNYVAIF